MSNELMVKCDLCDEVIAKIDKSLISYPMTGAMFKSPDSAHGIPDPFDKSLSWDDFRCPYGGTHRPIISRDTISTTTGQYRVPKDGIQGGFVDKKGEIDREAVIDRTIVPTDEQAEAIVRADMSAKSHENKDIIVCDVCGKSFQKRGYMAHRKSHKEINNA